MKYNLLEEVNKMRSMMSLGVINEFNIGDRTGMSEFMSEEADSPDTLIKLMSKYTPKNGWLVTIGYLNNTKILVTVDPTKDLEDKGRAFGDEYIDSIVNSDEWKSGKMKHPHAERTINGEKIYSTIFKLKTYTCQWLNPDARNAMKATRDADTMNAYTTAGVPPIEINPNDPRGGGWENIENTPFDLHKGTPEKPGTGNVRFAMYRKANCYKDSPSIFFIKKGDSIEELSKEKVDFFYEISKTDNSKKPSKRLAAIEDEQLRKKLWSIESLYEFKDLNLNKIPFLNCTCEIDGKNVRLTYINRNSAPDGINPGDFKQFIEKEIKDL